jgi:hypothetical protein
VLTEAPQPDSAKVQAWLQKASRAMSAQEAVALLAQLVPEYTVPAANRTYEPPRETLTEDRMGLPFPHPVR